MVPVSSSAQLTLLPWLLRWPAQGQANTYAAGLHAGSAAGIAYALRSDLRALDRRSVALLAASTLPAVAVGLLVGDRVQRRLGQPGPTAALLALAGVAYWAADRRPETVTGVGTRAAAVAALAQVGALVPGVSRYGATLTALRLVQVDRAAAQQFSLLMSLPVTVGAAGLTLSRALRGTQHASQRRELAGPLLVGTPLAALAAGVLTTHRGAVQGARGPAVYRLAVAAAVAARLRQTRNTTSPHIRESP